MAHKFRASGYNSEADTCLKSLNYAAWGKVYESGLSATIWDEIADAAEERKVNKIIFLRDNTRLSADYFERERQYESFYLRGDCEARSFIMDAAKWLAESANRLSHRELAALTIDSYFNQFAPY